LERCAPHEVARWKEHKYRFPPYQYKDDMCIQQPDGSLRPPSAAERERLLDFTHHFTATALPTRARKQSPEALEDVRCSLLGNSFHCGTVAWLAGHWAVRAGYLSSVPDVVDMRLKGPDRGVIGPPVVAHLSCGSHTDPSVQLAENMVRRATHRGSDVRLDTGDILRPDAWPRKPVDPSLWTWQSTHKWRWQSPGHITELEARSTLSAIRWRFRVAQHLRTRFGHLQDNQAALGLCIKCRSSSHILNIVVKRISSLCIAALARPFFLYTDTDRNPADGDSRDVEVSETVRNSHE